MTPTSRRITLAVIVLFWPAIRSVEAGVLFEDNFNNGASPLWSPESGDWTASGGVYYSATAAAGQSAGNTFLPFVLDSFAVEVDIAKLQDGGLWLRKSAAGAVLLVTGGEGGTGTGLYWHTYGPNGRTGPDGLVQGLFVSGVSDAHLRVVVQGNVYSVYVNGAETPASTITTDVASSGQVGLYDASGQTFDNFVLVELPEPSSVVLLVSGALTARFFRRRNPR